MGDINKAVEWLVSIANDSSHGYSQANRQGPDYDCSSHVLNALKKGGFDVNVNGYTGNMCSILKSVGFTEVTDGCKKGDIYLTPNKHTVMAYADGKVCTASGDKDGKPGESSDNEIYCRDFYTPSYGWTYHMRYTAGAGSTNNSNISKPTYVVGDVYTVVASDLIVRKGAGTNYNAVGYSGLTSDAKTKDTDKDGALNYGSRVTCKALKTVGNDIWMQIPSGWVAAYYNANIYVK